MSRPPWGRPRNQLKHELQALAFWLLLIGIGSYLLFPNFFKDIYSRLQLPAETAVQSNQSQTPSDSGQGLTDLPQVLQQVYGGNESGELSKGYWVVFVQDGQFQQMALSEETYRFILGLLAKDETTGTQKLILVANGQVRQLTVSEEVFSIVSQLHVIGNRSSSP